MVLVPNMARRVAVTGARGSGAVGTARDTRAVVTDGYRPAAPTRPKSPLLTSPNSRPGTTVSRTVNDDPPYTSKGSLTNPGSPIFRANTLGEDCLTQR